MKIFIVIEQKPKELVKQLTKLLFFQNHRNIDNELVILKKISTHRWNDYFTDEKQVNELNIAIEKSQLFLDERNKIEEQINNFKKGNIEYLKKGRVVPNELEKLIK
tara:strand:+ start:176 stop:493 length:318 start_codon:yes stop_codon:yes gene_type:complete